MSSINPSKHLTDLNEWRRLGEANIFPPDSRLELIEGEILEMVPIGSNHAGHLKHLIYLLSSQIEGKAIISVQDPLQLGDLSEPEPDLMLLKPRDDFYCAAHPQAEDVLLLIEIADSSLNFDQNHKLKLYARFNIPEYWLLNLNNNSLEVYRQPSGGIYDDKTTLQTGNNVRLLLLPTIELNLSDIL